jgi:hypothetical protein
MIYKSEDPEKFDMAIKIAMENARKAYQSDQRLHRSYAIDPDKVKTVRNQQ